MILKRRVALNGTQLDSIDSRICISSVEPGDGKENISAVDMAGRYGQRVTGQRRSTVDIVVKFTIRESGHSSSGMQGRAEVLEKVNAWAAPGGTLTVNYKPGRRLNVILAQAPGEGSLWDFTKEFQLTFRAYSIPYWEDSSETTLVSAENVTSNTTTVTIGGSVATPLTVTFENTSNATADTFSISGGGKSIAFSSLGLGAGERLVIDETSKGVFRARIRNTSAVYRSVLDKRTTASSDDLKAETGDTDIITSAAQAGTLSVKYRRRYL